MSLCMGVTHEQRRYHELRSTQKDKAQDKGSDVLSPQPTQALFKDQNAGLM